MQLQFRLCGYKFKSRRFDTIVIETEASFKHMFAPRGKDYP
jgi:hypothetical protein